MPFLARFRSHLLQAQNFECGAFFHAGLRSRGIGLGNMRDIDYRAPVSAADDIRARLREVDEQIAKYREMRKRLETALGAVLAIDEALPSTATTSSMLSSKMEENSDVLTKNVKIAMTMTVGASKAKLALLEAGLTPADVAAKLKVGRSTVSAWCRGARAIPKKYRDRLKAEYEIPPSVWLKKAD